TAGGVPGSLSNQPPPAGAVQPPGAAAAIAPAAASSSSQQSSRQYEIDRTLAYTRQPSGRLQRLTVAVLIDHLRVTNENGQVQEKPLSAGELERISTLVKDAVG